LKNDVFFLQLCIVCEVAVLPNLVLPVLMPQLVSLGFHQFYLNATKQPSIVEIW
jgi:hypothetical protein